MLTEETFKKEWKEKRIAAMNRIGRQKIGDEVRGISEMIEEYGEVMFSKARNKKEFKLEKKKQKESKSLI